MIAALLDKVFAPTPPWASLLATAIRVASGAIFLGFGASKFAHHTREARAFARYGLPDPGTFTYATGTLEVTLGAGRPFSEFGPGLEVYPMSGVLQVGLAVGAEETDRRIGERFSAMVDAGLVDEVRGLASRTRGISRTARQALGYREILAHVEDGVPLADCLEEAVRRSRQFARRQASWFRRDPRIRWSADPAEAWELLERALAVHG